MHGAGSGHEIRKFLKILKFDETRTEMIPAIRQSFSIFSPKKKKIDSMHRADFGGRIREILSKLRFEAIFG